MNDQDIIRKAVELADGWEYWDAQTSRCVIDRIKTPLGPMSVTEKTIGQPYLDALAAQLVRQVDALGGPFFDSRVRDAYVWLPGEELAHEHGPDRTMNTLRAIVESGVLDE